METVGTIALIALGFIGIVFSAWFFLEFTDMRERLDKIEKYIDRIRG